MTAVNREKHLELIQAVVARMANNSFVLRGWSVTVVAGLLAVSVSETKALFAVLAVVPIFSFCALDAYYLWHERRFRWLYDRTRTALEQELAKDPYSLNPHPPADPGWLRTMWRPAVFLVHLPLLAAAAVVALLLW